jgi:cytochrome c1
VSGANGKVGPDLTHVGARAEIAGTLANDPELMVRWLMHPQALKPGSGMPEQGVTERDARDMAAYLYTSK